MVTPASWRRTLTPTRRAGRRTSGSKARSTCSSTGRTTRTTCSGSRCVCGLAPMSRRSPRRCVTGSARAAGESSPGSSATRRRPPDLREQLLERGAVPDPSEPVYAGMVLTDAPPAVAGLEVRPVETFDEYALVRELGWDLLEMSEEERAEPRTRLQAMWDDYQDIEIVNFAAFIDDRLVAAGGVQFTPYGAYLAGGSTHPDYRGRGCYRALVRARWDAAAARGTPLLAAHAGKLSKPILERLGFRQLATCTR